MTKAQRAVLVRADSAWELVFLSFYDGESGSMNVPALLADVLRGDVAFKYDG